MKLLIPIILLSASIAHAHPAAVMPTASNITYDKIKHPEKAMAPEQAEAILQGMQQQRNDEEEDSRYKSQNKQQRVGPHH
ncbi:uncharacterized protein (UPF0333 family) [Mucilaginibacter sp. UYNi724]